MTGQFPNHTVDHINGDKRDNRWCNLRCATFSQNSANAKPKIGRSSAFKGVSRTRKRWQAHIKIGGKSLYLGSFDDEESAHAAYARASEEIFREFARAK